MKRHPDEAALPARVLLSRQQRAGGRSRSEPDGCLRVRPFRLEVATRRGVGPSGGRPVGSGPMGRMARPAGCSLPAGGCNGEGVSFLWAGGEACWWLPSGGRVQRGCVLPSGGRPGWTLPRCRRCAGIGPARSGPSGRRPQRGCSFCRKDGGRRRGDPWGWTEEDGCASGWRSAGVAAGPGAGRGSPGSALPEGFVPVGGCSGVGILPSGRRRIGATHRQRVAGTYSGKGRRRNPFVHRAKVGVGGRPRCRR